MDEQRGTPQTSNRASAAGTGGEDGMLVLSYVLSGILFYGGLGWLGSSYLHQTWMLPVGLILGLVASMYLVVKRVGSKW